MAGVPECHTLQQVLFPRAGLPRSLYLYSDGTGEAEPLEAVAGPPESSFVLASGEVLSTDAYFNCLYLSYWRTFTASGRIGVRVSCRGHIRISVHCRDEPVDTVRPRVREEVHDAHGSEAVLWLDEECGREGASGRLFVEIEALAASRVESIEFVTDRPPLRDVTLSIGICTFNREASLTQTLRELRDVADKNAAIGRVHVVNQGRRFQLSELTEMFRDPRFALIEQSNLGGCGGHNRTMYEALVQEPRCSHHLLMDDDVILDGRIIHNAMLFLGYAQHDFVLGGSMLYVSKPMTLHEAGSAFDPLWFINRLGDGTDLAEPSGLDFFNTWHRADYIGWWFCATPTRQIEAAGLSPPIFLHHDDIEYGCRLAKCGVPTIAPPGLAVWHEHSFSKDGEWEQYYDIRNRLILSVMHGDKTPQPRTPIVLGYVVDLVLTHRYRAAMMCIAGVSDFLLGPDRLFSVSPAERHRQVRAIAEVFQPDEMTATEALAHEWGEVVDRPKSLGANLLPYLLRLLTVLFLPYRTKCPRIFDHENVNPIAVGNAAYIMTNGCMSVFVRQVPNRLRAVSILWRGLTVAVRFRIRRDAVNADWSARLGAYQTTQAWKTLFGVSD